MKGSAESRIMRGSKINSTHHTTAEVGRVIKMLKELNSVRKLVPGPIKHTGPGRRRIKIDQLSSSTRAKIRGNTAEQILFIYSDAPEEIAMVLSKYDLGNGF